MPPGLLASDFVHLLPEIVLTIGALLMLVVDVLAPARRAMLTGVALAVLAVTLGAVVRDLHVDVSIAGGLLAVDGFGTFFKVTFLVVGMLTVMMSHRYLAIERVSPGEYHFLVLCATLGMMVMAAATDLISGFIGLETMAVSFYILTGYIKPNPRSNEAAVKYFLLGAFSLAIMLYGMSILYGVSGTTHLLAMAPVIAGQERDPRLLLAVVLIVAGLGFKIAAAPFHMWAPDVYEGAPTPVTAFLSVGSKAASFAMLFRIFGQGLPALVSDWSLLFEVLAIVTMTVGNVAAMTQSNIKRMLAYSSIAHGGYVLIGVVAGTTRGVSAALFYLAVYALMQLGAFAVVILLRRADAIGDELKDLAGLSGRHPFAAFAMLLFLLSLGGTPPTAGFMGKFRLFAAAIDSGHVALAVFGVLNSVLSLYYYLRIVMFMYQRGEASGSEPRFTPLLASTVAVAAVGTLVLGVYPTLLIDAADASARALGAVSTIAQQR
ncbi:MAG: NADH-quinone oxidoreductase subunit N [Vicinamibacterales bacterium]